MKKLLVLTMVLVSANSFALTTRLDFQVRSSGPDAFPCNAGIKHEYSTTARYGHQVDGCVGENCLAGFETETGTGNGDITALNNNLNWGLILPDVMKGHMGVYNPTSEDSEAMESSSPFHFKATYNGYYAILAEQSLAILSDLTKGDFHRTGGGATVRKNNVLTDLVFLLASEQYGTEYFVDVCNYFPELYCDGADCNITHSDMWDTAPQSYWENLYAFFSGKKEGTLDYIATSKLGVSVETWCDGKLLGSKGTETPDGLVSKLMGYLGTVPPKKCVTRFTFKEAATDKMRLNQIQNACFEVGTQVDESATGGSEALVF